jgi:hypothetical protein
MSENIKGTGFNGKYKRLPAIFREKLSKAMPAEAIKPHPTKTYLTTIKAIYIVERLNDVFGLNGWDFESDIISTTPIDNGKLVVVACGRLYFREFDLYGSIHYGGHEGKMIDAGDIHKSAITDALNKCASIIEIGIQVFKGKPKSSEKNVSKRLDEQPKENPLAKPAYEPINEPEKTPDNADALLFIKLSDEHVRLFGKKPRSNISLSNLKLKIEQAKTEKANTPEPAIESSSYEPIAEAEVVGMDAEHMDAIDRSISSYVDIETFKAEYKSVYNDAKNKGATEEQLITIQKMLNAKNVELKKLED